MNVLVIGSGGREYTTVLKLLKSEGVKKIDFVPGNGGTATLPAHVTNVTISPTDIKALVTYTQKNDIDLTVVGPEAPLCAGIVDAFREADLLICGPDKTAAQLEGSKLFTKEVLERYEVPTAVFMDFDKFADALDFVREHFTQRPDKKIVVKADGLASGKGVAICNTFKEAESFLKQLMLDGAFKGAGETVVIEEFLEGQELSFMALYDGKNIQLMLASQDHKQRFEGDTGPMTGGMGAFCPVPWVSEKMISQFADDYIVPLLEGLKNDYGITYTGFLYVALMFTEDGFKVLEWNVRPGDPETQVVFPLLKSDLAKYLLACAKGTLGALPRFEWHDSKHAVCISLCEDPYPESPKGGYEISGLEEAGKLDGVTIIHAGTKMVDGKLVTAGGRVLYVICVADTLLEAQKRANQAAELIQFENKVYRNDIGNRPWPKNLVH